LSWVVGRGEGREEKQTAESDSRKNGKKGELRDLNPFKNCGLRENR